MSYKQPHRSCPQSVAELSEFLRDTEKPVFFGAGADSMSGHPTDYNIRSREMSTFWRTHEAEAGDVDPVRWEARRSKLRERSEEVFADLTRLELDRFTGIIEFSPEDQVVKVRTHTDINVQTYREQDGSTFEIGGELQLELLKHGQCLPFARPIAQPGIDALMNQGGHLGRSLAINNPHVLEAQCGNWRDWVLGMTIVLADGRIVKTGSSVVKSVAGYDLHKLMIGTHDTLGVMVDVTLRTFPFSALPEPQVVIGPAWHERRNDIKLNRHAWTQRVPRQDFGTAVAAVGPQLVMADLASCALWCWLDSPDQELPRYAGDWVIRSGCGAMNLEFTDPTQIALMRRAKDIFDPTHKLNPGEMGIF